MDVSTLQLEKAALLHHLIVGDVGERMKDVLPPHDSEWWGGLSQEVLDGNKELLEEASRIAMGTHYRQAEGKPWADGVLHNVFNVFQGKGAQDNTAYPTEPVENEVTLYPCNPEEAAKGSLMTVLSAFGKKVSDRPLDAWSPYQLSKLMEIYLSYVPVKDTVGLNDISFFDHSKLTAAYGVCLHEWMRERGMVQCDYIALRKERMYLLVSGDVSGVQKFIYTIPSKGALKSLRGRSFYLEVLLENIVDEILEATGLSRSCLLYTGGGHFYLLLPNTDKMREFLSEFSNVINGWFLENFGSLLYMAMAWTPCTSSEFMEQAGEPFRRVSRELAHRKLSRYDKEQLKAMFSPDSRYNKTLDGSRECGICHASAKKLSAYNESDEVEACQSCRNLFHLGERMLADDAFMVSDENREDALPLPGWKRQLYLYPATEQEVSSQTISITRIYLKNKVFSDLPQAVCLWLADYSAKEGGRVLEFEDLASRSGGKKSLSGIKRLGVLRADVDNLGAAFIAGFPAEYASLSRTAVLSRQLSVFFKRYMNHICRGELNGKGEQERKKFSLFGRTKKLERDIHVVYSGGDDVFLVGAWDDLIELAIDIRRAFGRFTGGKLTFSAGIVFFPSGCPVHTMARNTGELEDTAKENPGKDSIALFGTPSEVHGKSRQTDQSQCYTWKDFVDCVCGEKLSFLLKQFPEDGEKLLPIGKSWLYRVLALLDDTENGAGSINLARFAYVLARLDPGDENPVAKDAYGKVRTKLYGWYQDEKERKELRTAIELMIYYLRETEEEG